MVLKQKFSPLFIIIGFLWQCLAILWLYFLKSKSLSVSRRVAQCISCPFGPSARTKQVVSKRNQACHRTSLLWPHEPSNEKTKTVNSKKKSLRKGHGNTQHEKSHVDFFHFAVVWISVLFYIIFAYLPVTANTRMFTRRITWILDE